MLGGDSLLNGNHPSTLLSQEKAFISAQFESEVNLRISLFQDYFSVQDFGFAVCQSMQLSTRIETVFLISLHNIGEIMMDANLGFISFSFAVYGVHMRKS